MIIWCREQLEDYKDRYGNKVSVDFPHYPYILYEEYRDFGIGGDGYVTCYHPIPEEFSHRIEIAEGYAAGFKNGRGR